MFYTGVNEKYLSLPTPLLNADSLYFSAMKKCNPAEKYLRVTLLPKANSCVNN